jgi:hypothetical protein
MFYGERYVATTAIDPLDYVLSDRASPLRIHRLDMNDVNLPIQRVVGSSTQRDLVRVIVSSVPMVI